MDDNFDAADALRELKSAQEQMKAFQVLIEIGAILEESQRADGGPAQEHIDRCVQRILAYGDQRAMESIGG